MADRVWVINKGSVDFEKIDMDLKRKIVLKPLRPVQLPRDTALRYIKFKTIFLCSDPERYFDQEELRRLVIRDAGIGDLLLLEPCIRKMYENGDSVTVLTRFPDVYKMNPSIRAMIPMSSRAEIPTDVDVYSWDSYEDLRSYSETCQNREKKHRTDCYNQVYNLDLEDKEPRIYFSKDEKSVIEKKSGYRYIGLACDGSHYFRRYAYGNDLIKYILEADKKNIVVLIGDGWEDGQGYVKARANERVIDLQGKTNIRQMMNLVKDLDYLVSVDTGIMHVGLSLHVPTVCIFSIIEPELRVKYYTGQYSVIYDKSLDCIGCGSWHMAKCKHGTGKEFVPPCLQIKPNDIYDKLMALQPQEEKRIFINDDSKQEIKEEEVKTLNVRRLPDKKLTLPIIVLNEEKNLPRFIELVMKNRDIGRVIAIDGGSDDNTIDTLKKAGAEVYMHYYDKDYHDAQALQRNISCSFVKDGERILIMDIDECFSDDLAAYLPVLTECHEGYGLISRRTFKYYADINDPMKQIKDYPDYQPRFFIWNRQMKWVGSPHHNIYNAPDPIHIKRDIIHFECEGKDRVALEAKWSVMEKKSKVVYT